MILLDKVKKLYKYLMERIIFNNLYFISYPGIFAIDLHKRINGEIDH